MKIRVYAHNKCETDATDKGVKIHTGGEMRDVEGFVNGEAFMDMTNIDSLSDANVVVLDADFFRYLIQCKLQLEYGDDKK